MTDILHIIGWITLGTIILIVVGLLSMVVYCIFFLKYEPELDEHGVNNKKEIADETRKVQ